MNIIGISALYHDSACCLLQDGVLKAAAQEERFTRIKHDSSMPFHAFKYCLESAGLSITEIDCIAYYENPEKKLARQLWSGYDIHDPEYTDRLDPHRYIREIREVLGYTGPVEIVEHHLSHAASSYYFSGFDEAAILTVDGVGEWATTTYGVGKREKIELFEQVDFPNSIGLLYSTITSYLGFAVNSDEYKVMGLAPYGKPVYVDKIRKLITLQDNGQYALDMNFFDFGPGEYMFTDQLIELFGMPPRVPESELKQFHKDVAKSLQTVLEEILLTKAKYLHRKTGLTNLCMAGGVALNCVANGKILRETPFQNLFVQPAANDAGGAVGAAAVAHVRLSGGEKPAPLRHVFLGPEYSDDEIKNLLDATAISYTDFRHSTDELLKTTALLLSQNKVIAWFQGKMEFGPRALGARSILADPRVKDMKDRINSMVKKREGFRPFAPAVLQEKMHKHFALETPSPYMLLTCDVISPIDMPAITHVDGSARVQSVDRETNPLFYRLIQEFERITNCPVLLNTSFNVRGEPIVMTPLDALLCFINTNLDHLVLGHFLISRDQTRSFAVLKMLLGNTRKVYSYSSNRYSFV